MPLTFVSSTSKTDICRYQFYELWTNGFRIPNHHSPLIFNLIFWKLILKCDQDLRCKLRNLYQPRGTVTLVFQWFLNVGHFLLAICIFKFSREIVIIVSFANQLFQINSFIFENVWVFYNINANNHVGSRFITLVTY